MPSSMNSLRQSAAVTCSERQALLNAREKIIYQGVSKQSDLSKAQATKGCCPDMCPERERYMREERRQVNVYEMVPGTEAVSLNLVNTTTTGHYTITNYQLMFLIYNNT